jgi:hypothetical protein
MTDYGVGSALSQTNRRMQLCASSKDEMVAWIHALHVQIGLCSENHRLYEAEIWITEDVRHAHSLQPLLRFAGILDLLGRHAQ